MYTKDDEKEAKFISNINICVIFKDNVIFNYSMFNWRWTRNNCYQNLFSFHSLHYGLILAN